MNIKIVTLNTWAGRLTKELIIFLGNNQDIDVFCFQEVYNRASSEQAEEGGVDRNLVLFDDIANALPNHSGYFRPHYLEIFGLAIFVKKDLKVAREEEFYVYKEKGYVPEAEFGDHACNVSLVTLEIDNAKLNIFNIHGLWNGHGKTDSEDRLNQSKKLIEYLNRFDGGKVLCGDFNLEPDTQSIKIIESVPMKNLIKEYKITSTRTSYYPKDTRYADYVFVNDRVKVVDFQVMKEEVSDHSGLMLEIEV